VSWRDHGLIGVIALAFVFLAVQEMTRPDVGRMESPTPPDSLLDAEHNIVDVYSELYPGRTSSFYFRAMQAYLCSREPHRRKPQCRRESRDRGDQMRELLAQAVSARNRSNEKVIYNYLLVLIGVGAPDEEIAAAIRRWHLDHPYSRLPDPRRLAAEPERAQRP
jgi:hypothetical protein